MPESAIRFREVSKKFRKGERHDSLRDLIPSLVRRWTHGRRTEELKNREFWALKDVSFEAARGEALGIIGRNGSGKSTTLKLLTGILRPNQGSIAVNGRVSALIEVGAGFHPDLTGRENIYLNGSILGMRRSEIQARFDEIVAFSELQEFLDTPVKRYSSGMYARLGFSVAAHVNPDVLLVDEVLSVGDTVFQAKCVERIRQLLRQGTTVVFISHNMEAVIELCPRVILLDRGALCIDGAASDVVHEYWNRLHAAEPIDPNLPVSVVQVVFLDERDAGTSTLKYGGDARLRLRFHARERVLHPVIAVAFYDEKDTCIYGHSSKIDHCDLGEVEGDFEVIIDYPALPLQPGHYLLTIAVLDALNATPYVLRDRAYGFLVSGRRQGSGLIRFPHSWTQVRNHSTVALPGQSAPRT